MADKITGAISERNLSLSKLGERRKNMEEQKKNMSRKRLIRLEG